MSEMFTRNVEGTTEILKSCIVGIAGCGGIGSNVATSLARSGVTHFIIVDMDLVEITNLNRQHYFHSDIGKIKVDALEAHLQNINPDISVIKHFGKLTRENYLDVFNDVDILIEAFDLAHEKKWLIEGWIKNKPSVPIIAGSGLSGRGMIDQIKVQKSGNIIVCGDQVSDMSEGLICPKVLMVANLQAFQAIDQLLNTEENK